jgi:hypothetical protein
MMKSLEFSTEGVCRIRLDGLPDHTELEELIEEYVTKVEILPYHLWVILIDISELVHMGIRSRQVFSELLIQASKHYGGQVEVVIGGGAINLVRFLKLFMKNIGFKEKSHFFEDIGEAESWIARQYADSAVPQQ